MNSLKSQLLVVELNLCPGLWWHLTVLWQNSEAYVSWNHRILADFKKKKKSARLGLLVFSREFWNHTSLWIKLVAYQLSIFISQRHTKSLSPVEPVPPPRGHTPHSAGILGASQTPQGKQSPSPAGGSGEWWLDHWS